MPVTFTTTLLSVADLQLDNGVLDEISISHEQTSNNGVYETEFRSGSEDNWAAINERPFDDTEAVIDGLLDGEEYEVRVRASTEYATSSWVDSAIVTKFPGAEDLTATAVDTTTVTLSWTENADNEDGQLVIRELQFPDGSWGQERILTDVGADSESYTDDTPQPGNTYRYRIRAFTEFASADSDTSTATTESIGLPRRRIPASGPFVIVDPREDGEDSGDELTPTVLSGFQRRPRLKDKPEVQIPVPQSDRWDEYADRRVPLLVFDDGDQLPIDRLDRVEHETDRTILIGHGGNDLDNYVERSVVEAREAHQVVDELITEETDLVSNVDEPETLGFEDVRILSADLFTDWTDRLGSQIEDDVPLRIDIDGFVEDTNVSDLKAYFGSNDGENISGNVQDGQYIDGTAAILEEPGHFVEWTLSFEHEIPAGEMDVQIRITHDDTGEGDDHPSYDLITNGTVADPIPEGARPNETPSWYSFPAAEESTDEVTIRVEVTGSADGRIIVDGGNAYDERFESQLDFPDTNGDGTINGPQRYPNELPVSTEDGEVVEVVTDARLETSWDDTSNGQAIAISFDAGQTWIEEPNTESMTAQPDDDGLTSSARARFTFSRGDGGGSIPSTGNQPQRLDLMELFVDTDDVPLLGAQQLTGSVMDVLNDIAGQTDYIWELQRRDGETTIEWTLPGQREATVDGGELLDYSTATDTQELVAEARVFGGSRPRSGQRVTVSTSGFAALGREYIQPNSVEVYQEDDEGDRTTYEPNVDYVLRPIEGGIRATEAGDLVDGDDVRVDFDHKILAIEEAPDPLPNGDTVSRQIPDIGSTQTAAQAAKFVLRRLSRSSIEATVELDRTETGFQLIDAINLGGLPVDRPLPTNSVDADQESVQLSLGADETASDLFDDVEQRFETLQQLQ